MYIGNDLQIAHPSYKIIDDISSGFNGSATSFALQVSGATPVPFPISTQQVMISVNGVVQEPDPSGSAGFKLLGSNIVFSSAPANGHAFFGVINAGADYVTAGSEFPDGSATAPSFTFQDDQDTGWFRSGSGAVGYSANGVQTLTFDGNGLTVTGDASFVGDSAKNLFWDKSDGALEFADNAKATFGDSLSIYNNGTDSFIDNATGNLNIRVNSNEVCLVAAPNAATYLYFNGLKKIETSNTGATITGTLVSDGLTVDTNTLHVDAANNRVGIGLTAPQKLLDCRGEFAISNSNTSYWDFDRDDSDGSLKIKDTGTERMRIDSSGKLGIGLTNPTSPLDITGGSDNTIIQIRSTDAGAYMTAIDNTGAGSFGQQGAATVITCDAGASVADSAIVFQIDANNERMRIDSSGRVLIGTTTEGYARADNLTVYEDGDCGITIRSAAAGYGSINFSRGTSGSNEYKGDIEYFHNTDTLSFRTHATVALSINSSQNATFTGTVSDSKGDVRDIILNNRTAAYVVVASDNGKCIYINTGGVTIPDAVMSQGNAITIINNSGSDQTITQGSGLTMYNAADAATGNRTLAGRGMATIWFREESYCYISGAGLS